MKEVATNMRMAVLIPVQDVKEVENIIMTTTQKTALQNEKEDLIELIEWYRDEYFKSRLDDQCNQYIREIKRIDNIAGLEVYHQILDDWFDLNW